MKILLPLFLLVNLMFASTFKVGDDMSSVKVTDQFDKVLQVNSDVKKVIVVFSKDKGNEIREFLDSNPNYLKENGAIYLADVSAAPGFVTNMFMVPKFKKYSYSMGLIRDEDIAKQFPTQEEMITIFDVDNSVIKNIEFKKSLK